MITLSVARTHGPEFEPAKFIKRSPRARLEIEIEDEPEGRQELSIPFSQRSEAPGFLVSAVIRHEHPQKTERLEIRDGRIVRIEVIERATELTRVWFGPRGFILFWFRGRFPGQGYPQHRLLVARCIAGQSTPDTQQIVIPVHYDLTRTRTLFHQHIWDQNFRREAPIRDGRIRGPAMEQDPHYGLFADIKSFIGVTIPTVGSLEKVKVLADGRLQFMSWQAEQLEERDTSPAILEKILEVLGELKSCEA